jgi:hypothetical protein
MKWLTLIMVLLLGLGIGSGGAAEKSASELARPPLPPEGIRVVLPDPGLPADIRAFSGSWYGVWFDPDHPEKGIREMLVVEDIPAQDKVNVIFSWGECPVCQSKADWRRFPGKIVNLCVDWQKLPGPFSKVSSDALGEKKVLAFGYPEGRTFTFVLDADGQLLGTDGWGSIKMKRLE